MLNINKNLDGEKLMVALEGRLDTVTAPEFETELKDSLDAVTELIMDMKDLEYISSAGLRVLLACQKKMMKQGKMTVCNPNDVITEIFEVTGFSEILDIK